MPRFRKTVFFTALALALGMVLASIARLDWLLPFRPDSAALLLLASLEIVGLLLPSLMPARWHTRAGALTLPIVVLLAVSLAGTSGYGFLTVWVSLPFSYLLLFTLGLPLIWKALRGSFLSCRSACFAGMLCTVPAIFMHFSGSPDWAERHAVLFIAWIVLGAVIGIALLWRRTGTILPGP